jgi:hypothetical protein
LLLSTLLVGGPVAALAPSTSCAGEITVAVSNTTPNCRDASEQKHHVCLPPEQRVKTYSVSLTSRNGNSDVLDQEVDTAKPNCVTIRTRAVPNGEDCLNLGIGKVCNCRGRGWIGLAVTLVGE